MFCIKCGTKLPEDAVFCFKCGNKVAVEQNEKIELVPNAQLQAEEDVSVLSGTNARFVKILNSAKQGNVLAMTALAESYLKGKNCVMDREQALIWYRKAAEQGDQDAKLQVEKLERDLNVKQKGIGKLKIKEVVNFGVYDGEDIEWFVVRVEEGKALLLSKYILDKMEINESTDDCSWERSTLRIWLNENFYDEAFSDDEKEKIIDIEYSSRFDLTDAMNVASKNMNNPVAGISALMFGLMNMMPGMKDPLKQMKIPDEDNETAKEDVTVHDCMMELEGKDSIQKDHVFILSNEDVKRLWKMKKQRIGETRDLEVVGWWVRNADQYTSNIRDFECVNEEGDFEKTLIDDTQDDEKCRGVRPAIWIKL